MNKRVFSIITTWTLRILFVIVCFFGICLLMLSTIGGNSEYHRQGLQQAFSDTLKSDVTIGTLDQFNIMPQLVLNVRDLHGKSRQGKNEYMADKIKMAFGFADLAFGRRRIEDFQLDNLRFSADSDLPLKVDHAGINAEKSSFDAKGNFDDSDFLFNIDLIKKDVARPVYHFGDKSRFSGKFGHLDFTGDIVANDVESDHIIPEIAITSDGRDVAKGAGVRKASTLHINIDCASPPPAKAAADFKKLQKIPFITVASNCAP